MAFRDGGTWIRFSAVSMVLIWCKLMWARNITKSRVGWIYQTNRHIQEISGIAENGGQRWSHWIYACTIVWKMIKYTPFLAHTVLDEPLLPRRLGKWGLCKQSRSGRKLHSGWGRNTFKQVQVAWLLLRMFSFHYALPYPKK